MKSKWLTLLGVSSLGLTVWLCRPSADGALAADTDATASDLGSADERRRALDLLRQATVELQANRLDEARRLAKQAASLNATYSLFDVRPEHVLAEIERKERAGGVYAKTPTPVPEHHQPESQVVPTQKPVSALVAAAGEPSDPFAPPKAAEVPKAGKESTVSDGSKVPEPQKASDAAGLPSRMFPFEQAAAEQASPPEHIASPPASDRLKARAIEALDRGLQALDEQRLDDADRYARAALALHASFGKLEYKPEYLITEIGIARARLRLDAATSQSASQSQRPTTSAERPAQRPAAPAPLAAAPAVAQPHAAAQASAITGGAASSHERAERLLQEALADLHAGRDEMARARIEGALGVIHPGISRPLPMFPATDPATVAMPSPTPRQDPPQRAMPRAGLPSYVPDPRFEEHDAALKPIHDPYFGDEPRKRTAAEDSLRETLPSDVPMSTSLSLNRPLPRMTDEVPHSTANVSNVAYAPAGVSPPQSTVAPQSQSARVRWPESDPAPAAAQTAAAPSAQNAAPGQPDPRSPSSPRYSFAPVTMKSWKPDPPEEEQPGYFRRLWNALVGD
ncbi:MAG TPA: hypothetical protein VFG04_04375 [Planctomycetaceae bacterium]|jgi:hypothetical protein|nr:hypothetical protein [Planctomycetaceae bacterium]